MQHLVDLPRGESLKLYYSKKVYSPAYSSSDTILLVDKLIKDGKKTTATILDVGCGTGIIGLGVKKLYPHARVTLCDVDPEAIRITTLNSKRLGLEVKVQQSNLTPPGYWDIIVANLPTYSEEDMSQNLHGPAVAYFGGKNPLQSYEDLFASAKGRCKALVCECQLKYQEPFLTMAKEKGWRLILHSEFGFAFLPPESVF